MPAQKKPRRAAASPDGKSGPPSEAPEDPEAKALAKQKAKEQTSAVNSLKPLKARLSAAQAQSKLFEQHIEDSAPGWTTARRFTNAAKDNCGVICLQDHKATASEQIAERSAQMNKA